ncbi:hypothetical protein AGMMS49592_4000 [Endomicrobiia bacterium]|nr:hypothetical protein AGMMS49592_4000 [Endomicrobiia bacterium]
MSLVLTIFTANVFAVDIDLGFGLGCIVTKIKSLDDLTDGVVREQFPVRLKLKNGDIDRLMFNVDCLFGVSEKVKIGPRIAFLRNSADLTLPDWKVYEERKWYVENDRRIIPCEHPIYFQASAVLVPVMLGGSYNQKINKEFSLNGKLFLGIGFINTTTCQYDGDPAPDNTCELDSDLMMLPNTSVKKSARCFVANPSIGVQYDISKDARVGLDVGYLYTPATKSGFKDTKLDFSGFTVNLGLTIKI